MARMEPPRDTMPVMRRAVSGMKRNLVDQDSHTGPPLEQLVDFPHQRPGPGQVGQAEVNADELDPELDRQVRDRVGQQGPQLLCADELPARRRDVSPM